MDPDSPALAPPQDGGLVGSPSLFRWVLGFLLVGMAWGLTTPFMRRAALNKDLKLKAKRAAQSDTEAEAEAEQKSGIFGRMLTTLGSLLSNPGYTIPLLLNVTGSVWFFLLIGQAELSLTVPVTNSLAFLFTVLGEWWVDGKLIEKETWIGMACVLSGIGLCVYSKT